MTREHEDYLWDPSGPADPEVERLETTLSPLAWRGAACPVLPERRARPAGWRRAALAAASIGLAVAGAWAFLAGRDRSGVAGMTSLAPIAGRPEIDSVPIDVRTPVRSGQVVATDGASRAYLDLPEVGHVEVGAGTTLEVRRIGRELHELYLERGSIRALVSAPPRLFQVGTPSALAVDLGCLYTLSVDEAGNAILEVEMGQVALEGRGRSVLVPWLTVCRASRLHGPGTPVRTSAAEEVHRAAEAFDREGEVAPLLALLGREDAATLYSLLTHPLPAVRAGAYDRAIELDDPPPEATREATVEGRPEAMELWRGALGLDW